MEQSHIRTQRSEDEGHSWRDSFLQKVCRKREMGATNIKINITCKQFDKDTARAFAQTVAKLSRQRD